MPQAIWRYFHALALSNAGIRDNANEAENFEEAINQLASSMEKSPLQLIEPLFGKCELMVIVNRACR